LPVGELELRRLRWRCRRGMKELDVLLERFARGGLPAAGPAERCAFSELLELPDPELAGYLLGGVTPCVPHLALAVERIRHYVDPLGRWRYSDSRVSAK
jgi:antitoxin CptB